MTHAIFTRPDKFLPFKTKPEADAALEEVQKDWPDAFVAALPLGAPVDWDVDMQAQTVRPSNSKKAERELREYDTMLDELAARAREAELAVLVNIETGTTPEAIAYQEALAARPV